MAKGAPLADGLQATPPAGWARDPSAKDPQTNYGKVIAAYKLPGGSYVQVRYNACKNADQCGEMDFTADGLASDADDWSELCCTTERCGSLQSGKPRSSTTTGSSKGPGDKFACTDAMPVQPATEHLARVTRTRTGSDAIIDLTEHKVPLPRQRIAIITVTLTSAKARYDADRAALEQFLKSFVFPKTR